MPVELLLLTEICHYLRDGDRICRELELGL
jgi:hypothetical protein